MREIKGSAVAFAASSVVPAALFSLIWPLSGHHETYSIVASFVVFYPFSVATIVVIGLPAFLILRPLGVGRWWSVILIGLILGALTSIVKRLPSLPTIGDALRFAPIGGVTVLVFWLIWKQTKSTEFDDS